MTRRWSKSKRSNEKLIFQIPRENVHLIDLELIDKEQEYLKTPLKRYTSWGTSTAWRVHSGWLACVSLILGNPEDCYDISAELHDASSFKTLVDIVIF